jgi:YVTN family beta-propeller protein
LWVSNAEDDTVSRIDIRSWRVVDTIRVGDQPLGLTANGGAVWVANQEDDTVSRIDPSSNRVVRTIPVGDRPRYLGADSERVWVPNSGDGTLSTIDIATNRLIGEPLEVGDSVDRAVVGVEVVWATRPSDGTVVRVEEIN